jgi:hypothetical protein
MGRTFAYCSIVFFGKFSENYKSSPTLRATLFHGKSCVLIFTKKGTGNILVDFFHKPIWSPCSGVTVLSDARVFLSYHCAALSASAVHQPQQKLGSRGHPGQSSNMLRSRVARFLLVQNTKKGRSIPNDHKIYQKAIKYFKWP